MGLKLRLEWFGKKDESFAGSDYSKDFGDDASIIERLGVPLEDNINNGMLVVMPEWIALLQEHFKSRIDMSKFDYFIAFDYEEGNW